MLLPRNKTHAVSLPYGKKAVVVACRGDRRFQCAILLIPIDDKQQWLSLSPYGQPLLLWPAYIASLLTGFSVLLIGILITEHIQMYHRHLPEQAVDIKI